MKKRRVLVLVHHDLVPPDSIEGMTFEEIHPWKMEFDVISALRDLGHQVVVLPVDDELRPIREAIELHQPHVAFNLLRHFHGVPGYDANVLSYLELLRTPYTGVNPRGLLLASDKRLAKKILSYHRIHVPAFMVCRANQRFRPRKNLRYPLIVKTVDEHASLGISQASVVRDEATLRERVDYVHRNFGHEALVEEYIEGRELTIGVVGNERLSTFPVWEMTFENLPPGSKPIATARVKWDLGYQQKVGVHTGRAKGLDDKKEAAIARLAKRIYRALQMSGYARVDLRMPESGEIFVLEANPNPDLCYGEDFADSAHSIGLVYTDLIQKILNLGLGYRSPWKRVYDAP